MYMNKQLDSRTPYILNFYYSEAVGVWFPILWLFLEEMGYIFLESIKASKYDQK